MMNSSRGVFRAGPIYFTVACLIYLIGSTYFGVSALVWMSVASIGLSLLLGLVFGQPGRAAVLTTVGAAMLLVAGVNVLVSTDSTESLLRWLLWFAMFFGLGMLATAYDDAVDNALVFWVPIGASLIWLAKFSGADVDNAAETNYLSRLHLSAFFASLTLATGLFHPKKSFRAVFCLVGIYGVLESGSRAAILFLPLQFIFAFRQYFRSKIAAYAVAIIPVGILSALLLYEPFRDATFGKKAVQIGLDTMEDAQASMEDRAFLRELAFDFMADKPLGYGYGNTYSIPGENKNRGNNFHNALMNIGVPLGLHVMIGYVLLNLWLFWSLLRESRASRLYRNFFLAVLLCVNLRGLTEDFTLFDLGNPICYLVVFMTLLYLNRRRFLPQRVEI